MTRFTISAAARVCGCDRRTLQRAVQAGRLTLDAQHCLSREALVAAGYLDAPTPQVTPHDTPHITPHDMPQELTLATTLLTHLADLTTTIAALHQEVVLLREDLRQTPQRRRSLTPHVAPLPQEEPHGAPHVPATPASPPPLPPHVLKVAEVAAQYDKLSLAELAELLYHRGVYRAKDRTTGADKPLNRGTLKKWLDMARAAGVL